jgi:cytochrome c oxidase subunit 2
MCSELCGVNHQSMPIEIHVVTQKEFNDWVEEAKTKYASKNNKFANK